MQTSSDPSHTLDSCSRELCKSVGIVMLALGKLLNTEDCFVIFSLLYVGVVWAYVVCQAA